MQTSSTPRSIAAQPRGKAVPSGAAATPMACATLDEWIDRCCARLMQLDPMLAPAHVAPIVEDMSRRPCWLAMLPERAADAVFVPHPMRSRATAATA
jgi:hypothetical protein